MYRNKAAAAGETRKTQRRFILTLGCLLFWLFASPGSAGAAKVKVSLLLGDISSKTAIEAVKAIYQDYPNLKQKVEFRVYPTSGIREKNLAPLTESRLIFVWLMGRDLLEDVI
jgi:cobaltochelatase CobN